MQVELVVVLALCFQAQAQHFQYFYTNPVIPVSQFGWQQPQTYTPQIPQHARFQQGEDYYQSQVPIQLPADNYRGYTYHTSFDDGASSTVVFFRGPLAPAPPVNFIQNSTLHRHSLASDSVDTRASQNDIEHNIAVALNGRNHHLKNTALFKSPLSLIATMLEHPVQQNSIVHFFNQVPANTIRLGQPSIQSSESIISQYFAPNSLRYNEEKEDFPVHRKDKSLVDAFDVGARISKAPHTSTTSEPQPTYSTEASTMSPDSDSIVVDSSSNNTDNISVNLQGINTSSTTESKTTSEDVSATTMTGPIEESSTIAVLKKIDTSSSENMSSEGTVNESTGGQSTTSPAVSVTNNIGLVNSTTTDDTNKHTESTTTDENDSENTTKMIIIVV